GDLVSACLADAAEDRLSEISCTGSGPSRAKGCRGEGHQASLRQPERGLLPLREERQDGGVRKVARAADARDFSRAVVHHSYGEPEQTQEPAYSGTGPERTGQETVHGAIGNVGPDGHDERDRKSETPSSRCFLDQHRICEMSCKAYMIGHREPCRLL